MARKLSMDTSITADIKSASSNSFKDNLQMVEIEKIKPSMDNFYSLSDIEILAEDIERQGLKHNMVVVEDSENLGTYFIKSGHRRFEAIKLLSKENKYTSKYVPCLVDGTKSKNETILDLIMLNATTRVMTDSELFKQYEILKETLENLKHDGVKVKGRIREKVAETLNISPAQVGKIENIKHNAVPEVISAVESGEITIAIADSIAKLDETEQDEIISEVPMAEITTKSVKERKAKTKKKVADENCVTDDDILRMECVDEESSEEIIPEFEPDNFEELMSWASSLPKENINFLCDGGWYNNTIKGYLIASARNANFNEKQIKELLIGLKLAFSDYSKSEAEQIYFNYILSWR